MQDNPYSVYLHRNKTNNKVYIGLTSLQPENRWLKGKGYHKGTHFRNAIDLYGWDNFEHEILKDNLTKEEASYWECFYIDYYNSTNNLYGYNMSSGGEHGGCLHTEEAKRKIGQNGFHYGMLGKKHSEETKHKMSIARTGRTFSDDTIKKFRQSALKNRGRLFYCIELDQTFNNLSDASNITNCPKSAIVLCCQGKQQQSKGFHWKYAD